MNVILILKYISKNISYESRASILGRKIVLSFFGIKLVSSVAKNIYPLFGSITPFFTV